MEKIKVTENLIIDLTNTSVESVTLSMGLSTNPFIAHNCIQNILIRSNVSHFTTAYMNDLVVPAFSVEEDIVVKRSLD